MRLITTLPHEHYKIGIYDAMDNFCLKIELGEYEQSFKISKKAVTDANDLKSMVTDELLSNCLHRFIAMRSDWETAFKSK